MLKSTIVVGITSFKGGVGKSVITATLPVVFSKEHEEKSILLSLDKHRDAKKYSSEKIHVINFEDEERVINKDGKIFALKFVPTSDGKKELKECQLNTQNLDFVFIDFGGRWDSRITEAKCDYYLIPIYGKGESGTFQEGIRTAEFIRKNLPNTQILFLFNPFSVRDKKTKIEQKELLRDTLNAYNFSNCAIIELPSNYLFEKMTFEKTTLDSIIKAPIDYWNYNTRVKPALEEIYTVIKGV